MILIGMLHHRKMPTSIERTSFYALAAKEEGVDFIYFHLKGWILKIKSLMAMCIKTEFGNVQLNDFLMSFSMQGVLQSLIVQNRSLTD